MSPAIVALACRLRWRAGAADAFDRQGGAAGLFGDKPVLFFDHGTRRGIAVHAAKEFPRNSAIGPLRAVKGTKGGKNKG